MSNKPISAPYAAVPLQGLVSRQPVLGKDIPPAGHGRHAKPSATATILDEFLSSGREAEEFRFDAPGAAIRFHQTTSHLIRYRGRKGALPVFVVKRGLTVYLVRQEENLS